MIRERRNLSPGEPGSAPGEVPEESDGEQRARGLGEAWSRERPEESGGEQQARGLGEAWSRELGADDWEQRQAREVLSQGSTQEITPAILSD